MRGKKACSAAAVDHPDYVTLRQLLRSTFVTREMMRVPADMRLARDSGSLKRSVLESRGLHAHVH
jgi:hypothetical protein